MDVESKVIYKVFSGGQYIGLLPTPKTPFNYDQDINTGATELVLVVPQTLDMAPEDTEILTDESGNILTDESGFTLTTDRATDIVGVSGSGAIVANDNDIQAWGYSPKNPNGVLLFAGYISRWRGIVGPDNDVEVTITSYGKDMVDYIFGNSSFAAQIVQSTGDAAAGLGFGSHSANEQIAQTFTPASSFDITKITCDLAVLGPPLFPAEPGAFTVTCAVYSGSPTGSNTLLGSMAVLVSNLFDGTAGSYQSIVFLPASPISVVNGGSYFIRLSGSGTGIAKNSTGSVYAGGVLSKRSSGAWSSTGNDMVFTIFSGTLLTDASFSAYDPSQMIRDAIDGYNAQGGIVIYTDDSIDDTGLSIDYDFKTATVAEIVAKARELAPSNWFWYVDPATNILYFKEPQ